MIFLLYFLDAWLKRFLSLKFTFVTRNIIKLWYNSTKIVNTSLNFHAATSKIQIFATVHSNFVVEILLKRTDYDLFDNIFIIFFGCAVNKIFVVGVCICNLKSHQILIQLHRIFCFFIEFPRNDFKNWNLHDCLSKLYDETFAVKRW